MFLGLRTINHPAPDLDAAKAWWTKVLGIEPYFDEPFYVGFEVGGYELGLNPAQDPAVGPITFWGVGDVDAALARLLELGAEPFLEVNEVGGGIRVAAVRDPAGSIFGVIENPHFALPEAPPEQPGPGR